MREAAVVATKMCGTGPALTALPAADERDADAHFVKFWCFHITDDEDRCSNVSLRLQEKHTVVDEEVECGAELKKDV